ncbi:MAG: alkylation response protein AidB-like acyl-CoA dehydrogenase [Saprospiraceae bacterium]|jgi:alkylation response protein AidB-like acyl-CoA dehydrogenase
MGYVLTEEQRLLKDSAKDIYKAAPVATVRELRDNKDANGYSQELWNSIVESGWLGLAVTESNGGLGFGLRGVAVTMEEAGKSLSASPLHSVVTSSSVIEKYGSDDQKSLLENIVMDGKIIALGIQEGAFYNPQSPGSTISNNGTTLSGSKDMVADAHTADHLIVSAMDGDELSFYLVSADTEGVSIEKEFFMDSRFYSKVQLSNVSVSSGMKLGKSGEGKHIADHITNVASVLIANELVGLMSEAFERTLAYLKERKQFGVTIGSFQGLQHRAADTYGEIEIAKSLAAKACMALESGDVSAAALCSAAKAKCAKVSRVVTNEGVQMFGGIGMTDDEEIGFFMKRARVAAQLFGSYSFHVDRFATINGY